MAVTAVRPDTSALVLHLRPVFELDDEQLFELCALNNELRIERTAQGDLEIMSPTGASTGNQNSRLTAAITN